MSWLSSIFATPGESDFQDWLANAKKNAAYAEGILGPYSAYLGEQIPRIRTVTSNLYGYTTQGGRNQLVNNYWQNAMGRAKQNTLNSSYAFAGNPALKSAFALGGANDANNTAGQYDRALNSPQGQLGAYDAYLGSTSAGLPGISGLSQLIHDANYQTPPVGQSPLAALAPIAGSLIGGGSPWAALAGSFLGGGGGSPSTGSSMSSGVPATINPWTSQMGDTGYGNYNTQGPGGYYNFDPTYYSGG